MKNYVIYLIIMCITVLVAIVTGGEFAIFLLGFELVLPTFLYLYVRYLSRKLQVQIKVSSAVNKKEKLQVEVHVKNPTGVPVSCVMVKVICRDPFDGQVVTEVVSGAIDARGESCIRLGMTAEYAGRLEYQVGQMKVYDCFRLLSKAVVFEKEWRQTLIKPDIYRIAFDGTADALSLDQRGDAHSAEKSGDDVSEVFDIRAYRAGDNLHKIHWKLSAKTDDLLVREFSSPVKNALFVFVDLSVVHREQWTHECFDGMASILASLSQSLLERNEVHEVFWYDDGEGTLHSMTITQEKDIYETVGELSGAKPYDDPYDFRMVLRENGVYGEQTKIFLLDTEWNLYLGERRIASMSENDMQKELLNVRME